MKRLVSIAISLLFLTTMALAHGNEQHVMGTVTEVTETSITVETLNKQKVTVSVVQETKFIKGNAAATFKDVKLGDRVVIHAAKQGEQLQAYTVRIGTSSSSSSHRHTHQ